jgi:hypothetical protein
MMRLFRGPVTRVLEIGFPKVLANVLWVRPANIEFSVAPSGVKQSNSGSYAFRVKAEGLSWDAGRERAAGRRSLDHTFDA